MVPPSESYQSKMGGNLLSRHGSALDVLATQNIDDYDELTASQIDNMFKEVVGHEVPDDPPVKI
jgi:hypothetical protein